LDGLLSGKPPLFNSKLEFLKKNYIVRGVGNNGPSKNGPGKKWSGKYGVGKNNPR